MNRVPLLSKTLAIVMAGGHGERLYPLTRDRAKPAVPFGGIYRIIDFTLNNCVNSGLRRVMVLTQYKSISLERHIKVGWNVFNRELDEFIDTLPPQQRTDEHWYSGTADAIYQNIYTLEKERPEQVIILPGDHVYKMDYLELLRFHKKKNAHLTIASVEVPRKSAQHLGIMQVDSDQRVIGFQEKPDDPIPLPDNPDVALASMGIYVFDTETLVHKVIEDARCETSHDFGKDIIPAMLETERVYAYDFKDEDTGEPQYWRDIGTLDDYFDSNMDLVTITPKFNLYDRDWHIRTYQEQFPPAKTVFWGEDEEERKGQLLACLVSPGCIISGAHIERSILSPGVIAHSFAHIEDTILMEGVNVGRKARIRHAIIDKDVDIPPDMAIGYDRERDTEMFTVTESGLVVVAKGMVWS